MQVFHSFCAFLSISFSSICFATITSFYCPQYHGYIHTGMAEGEVMNACGQPLSKKVDQHSLTRKVPLVRLIYNNAGAPKTFYGVWAIPIGNANSNGSSFGANSGGQTLEVNLLKDKVQSITLNGSSSNAFSICNGQMIKVGDPSTLVYNSCGNPSQVNHSFVNEAIPSKQPPQVWLYQADKYQPPFSLTFMDGTLQSID